MKIASIDQPYQDNDEWSFKQWKTRVGDILEVLLEEA